jgi:energy-converting hydrogenase Eha subunit A
MDIQEAMKWLKAIGFEVAMFLAGLAGAWVSTNKQKSLTNLERVSAVFSGGLIANYITPVFVNLLNFTESTTYGVAFIVGYIGMKSVEYVIEIIHRKLDVKKNENNEDN